MEKLGEGDDIERPFATVAPGMGLNLAAGLAELDPTAGAGFGIGVQDKPFHNDVEAI